jgi:sulfatase maturation enzyme AslB (radical SAM superfamily)
MCGRNRLGGPDNELLSLHELSLAEIASILPPISLSRMQFIHFCGNFGDPAVAKDLFPSLRYVRSCNQSMGIGLSTNGSVRPPAWWSKVGSILNRNNDVCRLAIDGLSDTNSLYRRGTQFKKIMENAAAFIKAGGNASWVFLVFRHNEHQIEEAQTLAESMGFKSFQLKRTSRFPKNGKLEVLNRDSSSAGYELLPPSRDAWQHPLVSHR